MPILPFQQNNNGYSQSMEMAISRLQAGELIVLPTETVYGLAADATDGLAIANIFETKNRPSFNPLIAHIGSIEMAREIGILKPVHENLAAKFWPGPLTLVVRKRRDSQIHELGCAGLETIAIRFPKGPSGELIRLFGKPVFAPSANRSGKISPTNVDHVKTEFPNWDGLILDGGSCNSGLESTIVKVENEKIIILRPGSIGQEELQNASGLMVEFAKPDTEISAPGMMRSHYAPNAAIKLNCLKPQNFAAFLGFGNSALETKTETDLNLSHKGDLVEAASNLYRHLRQLDALGVSTICVAPIPETGLGIAINDRLARAAAPRPDENENSN